MIIKWPFLLLCSWMVLGLIVALSSYTTYTSIFGAPGVSIGITIILFLLIGYLAVSEYKATIKQAVYAGIIAGVLLGVLGIIISIIMTNATPMLDMTIQEAMAQAAQKGAPVSRTEMEGLVRIGLVISYVLAPVSNGGIGALTGWIGGLIGKKL